MAGPEGRAEILEEFAAALRDLRLDCGSPSYRRLQRYSSSLAPTTISDLLTAKSAPRLEVVLALVSACLRHAEGLGVEIDPPRRDLAGWQAAWRQLHTRLARPPAPLAAPAVSPLPASASPPAKVRGPCQLPAAPRGFVGRSRELGWLDRTMSVETSGETGVPSAVLKGMAGVGKTALALVWSHKNRKHFPDGQLFADLRGFDRQDPVDPAEVLDSFLAALGVSQTGSPSTLEDRAALYRSALADRRVLILLDNAASAQQVRALLPGTTGCGVLVTSRATFTGLGVRMGARSLEIEPLPAPDARAVLWAAENGPPPPDEVLDQLAAMCGHLPLALRLVAERVETDPASAVAGLLENIDQTHDVIGALEREVGDDSLLLGSVFSWSLAAHNPDEAQAFRLLALHPAGEFSVLAAAALLGAPSQTARHLADSLVATHLLSQPRRGRYCMHDLLRTWGSALSTPLARHRDADTAVDRLCDFYLYTADAIDRILLPQRHRDHLDPRVSPHGVEPHRVTTVEPGLRWVDQELPNLVAVTRLAAAIGREATAASLPFVLLSYFNLRKPWPQWIEMHETAIVVARRSHQDLMLANLLVGLGIAYRETGKLDRAIRLFTEAVDRYEALAQPAGRAMALNNLANAQGSAGRLVLKVEHLQQATTILEQVGDPWRAAIVLHNLAEAEHELGQLESALRHAEQARRAALSVGDRAGAATTLTTIAHIRALLGDTTAAEEEFREALAEQRAVNDNYGPASTHQRLGQLLLSLHRYAEAIHHLTTAADILGTIGDPKAAEARALTESAIEQAGPG